MSSQTKLLAKFENLPYFTKKDLAVIFAESKPNPTAPTNPAHKSNPALNRRITRLLKSRKLLQLKKGLYTTGKFYFTEPNKAKFTEFLSSAIYAPSYLSLEYVLKKHNLLAAANPANPADPTNANPATASASDPATSTNPTNPSNSITCVTTKTTRSFKNPLGNFRYSNIKPLLFCGFKKISFNSFTSFNSSNNYEYHIATKAKALFDYLYLKPNLKKSQKHLRQQLFETSGIIWKNFSKKDFEEFDKYVWKSNSKKMMDIWRIIDKSFASKDFDRQIKELLAE